MKLPKERYSGCLLTLAAVLLGVGVAAGADLAEIERVSKSGETLGVDVAKGSAVNAYLPKEVGIISLTKSGVLSVFAHELAHTMSGPVNDDGRTAGNWPQGNQGESHAGWFQGKAAALATGARVSHQPGKLFDFDKNATELDLALPDDQMREKWGKGKEWTKVWWVWQKLDDRYGPTWCPRWRRLTRGLQEMSGWRQ